MLRTLNKRLLFVTNNSTLSRSDYLLKFKKFGIQACKEEIFGSSYAAAVYISKIVKLPKNKKVFIIGMSGLQEELDSENIPWVGGQEEIAALHQVSTLKPDDSIGAVLFGMDLHISYTKYAKAFTYLNSNSECLFLATNNDLTYPSGNTVYPGTGALLAALSTSLGRNPLVLGKPNQPMMDAIIAKFELDVTKSVMIGDRLDTDILFGKQSGLATILVMTGVTKKSDLHDSTILPDYYLPSLSSLVYDFSNQVQVDRIDRSINRLEVDE